MFSSTAQCFDTHPVPAAVRARTGMTAPQMLPKVAGDGLGPTCRRRDEIGLHDGAGKVILLT